MEHDPAGGAGIASPAGFYPSATGWDSLAGLIPLPAAIVDEGGTVLGWNGRAEALFGRTREEMKGRIATRVLLSPDDSLVFEDRIRASLIRGDSASINDFASFETAADVRALGPGGRRLSLEVSIASSVHAGRRVLTAVFRDLGHGGALEEALREKEEFLESIYAGADQPLFVVDVAPDATLTFTGFNPAYIRLAAGFGVDMQRMLGRPVGELAVHLPAGAVAEIEKRYRDCAESGMPIEYEESVPIHGMATHWLTRLMPLAGHGARTFRIVGTSTNITRQKQVAARLLDAEEKLRQAEKMEAIGRLAGGIAHDFNNLLTAVKGFGSMIQEELPPDSPARDLAGEIVRAGEKAARLTAQLLAFSRKQEVRPQELGINEVIAGMESLLRRLIREDILLRIRPGPSLPSVRIDRGQLEQVILNLCINARDAMPEGGVIKVESYLRPKSASEPLRQKEMVVLEVVDTGTGMSEETLGQVFEPYFTTKEEGKGTGMGLATVYGIVQQSGGYLEVDSKPGDGSRFRVFLPSCGHP